MSNNIIEIFGKMDTDEDKIAFCEAQFSVITSLNKQISQLKAEKAQLERLLKDAVPTVTVLPTKEEQILSEEQIICKDQLMMLKSISKDRELTLEECRKVEIYSKILFQTRDTSKKAKSSVEGLPVADLLKLVE